VELIPGYCFKTSSESGKMDLQVTWVDGIGCSWLYP